MPIMHMLGCQSSLTSMFQMDALECPWSRACQQLDHPWFMVHLPIFFAQVSKRCLAFASLLTPCIPCHPFTPAMGKNKVAKRPAMVLGDDLREKAAKRMAIGHLQDSNSETPTGLGEEQQPAVAVKEESAHPGSAEEEGNGSEASAAQNPKGAGRPSGLACRKAQQSWQVWKKARLASR